MSDNLEKQKYILAEINSINPGFSIPKGEDKIEILNEILKNKRDKLKEINDIIERAAESEKQIIKLRDEEIPALQKVKQTAEKTKHDTETDQKLADQQIAEKQKSVSQKQKQYETENTAFLEKLTRYTVKDIEELKEWP